MGRPGQDASIVVVSLRSADQRVYLRRRLSDTHARFRVHASEPLFSAAYNLMASTLVTSVLGIGFWAAAARLYPASEVGRDSVLIGL